MNAVLIHGPDTSGLRVGVGQRPLSPMVFHPCMKCAGLAAYASVEVNDQAEALPVLAGTVVMRAPSAFRDFSTGNCGSDVPV